MPTAKKTLKSRTVKSEARVRKEAVSATDTQGESINIEPFLTPIAILLGSIIISISMFLSLRGANLSTPGSSVGVTPTTTAGPTTITSGTAKTQNGLVQGNKDTAKVAIVEFTDLECPFCQRHYLQTFPSINEKYIKTGKIVYITKFFPLSFHEPKASLEANATECVKNLKGEEAAISFFHEVFAKTESNGKGLKDTTIETIAQNLGVDANQFKDCVNQNKYKTILDSDTADGTAAGISGTPGFIVGKYDKNSNSVSGTFINGAQPYATFEQTIEALLAQ